jgi:hypothetical protein
MVTGEDIEFMLEAVTTIVHKSSRPESVERVAALN